MNAPLPTIDWRSLWDAAHPLLRWGCGPEDVARHSGGKPVYLATPYSLRATNALGHWRQELSDLAVEEAAVESARLTMAGVSAISPIVLSVTQCDAALFHPRLAALPGPMEAARWQAWCWPILNACGAVVVPDLIGWRESRGVWAEVAHARRCGMPVFLYAKGFDQ